MRFRKDGYREEIDKLDFMRSGCEVISLSVSGSHAKRVSDTHLLLLVLAGITLLVLVLCLLLIRLEAREGNTAELLDEPGRHSGGN